MTATKPSMPCATDKPKNRYRMMLERWALERVCPKDCKRIDVAVKARRRILHKNLDCLVKSVRHGKKREKMGTQERTLAQDGKIE